MPDDDPSCWTGFHRTALARPPRELLLRTLNFFAVEGRPPGVAVDLGCGSGPDTRELLRRGWHVHAVDAEPTGLAMLRDATPEDARARLSPHCARFESFDFPPCDLVWAGFALPFCDAGALATVLQRATAALRVGGRIAGDLFGDRHAWSAEPDVLTLAEPQARSLLGGLAVEAFDVEDGYRVSGREVTRWHAFGFAARKPAPAQ